MIIEDIYAKSNLEKPKLNADNTRMTVSAIIVTINRPDYVRRCLECLYAHTPSLDQIIVVDSSQDDRTEQVVAAFPRTVYRRNEAGDGHTTLSRNIGVKAATGEIIAFLDDDAYVRPGWLTALLAPYADPSVGAVGGRALRAQPDEEREGVEEIGLFTRNGILTGNFAADPGRMLDVDHLIGCNMSFRREVIARCGGFREGFPGYCLREESDIFLVLKRFGCRIVFNPEAVVDHVAGPKPKGKRFDVRYDYYAARNHYVLLIRNYGFFGPIVWRYFGVTAVRDCLDFGKRIATAFARLSVQIAGTLVGVAVGTLWRLRQGSDPVRRDAEGKEVTRLLGEEGAVPLPEEHRKREAVGTSPRDKSRPSPVKGG